MLTACERWRRTEVFWIRCGQLTWWRAFTPRRKMQLLHTTVSSRPHDASGTRKRLDSRERAHTEEWMSDGVKEGGEQLQWYTVSWRRGSRAAEVSPSDATEINPFFLPIWRLKHPLLAWTFKKKLQSYKFHQNKLIFLTVVTSRIAFSGS